MTTGIATLNLPHVRVVYKKKQATTLTDRQVCENELDRVSCAAEYQWSA
jgi:hypothetical protein